MKTAKEMFEELGYKQRTNVSDSMFSIVIYDKELYPVYFDFNKTVDVSNQIITFELFKAIQKQIEELEWK